MPLPAFAAALRASIDQYLLPAGPTAANPPPQRAKGTDRGRTDIMPLHIPCSTCYSGSGKNYINCRHINRRIISRTRSHRPIDGLLLGLSSFLDPTNPISVLFLSDFRLQLSSACHQMHDTPWSSIHALTVGPLLSNLLLALRQFCTLSILVSLARFLQ